MRKGAPPECDTCCKVLQLLKLYVAGMDLLLPQHPLEGPWPRAASSTADNQCVRTLDPDSSGARILLNQGQWTVEAGTGDLAATAPGLIPFVVHEAKCAQPKQRDPAARKRANEACIAAPWGLIGYFLDPVLFEMLARTARLSLPAEPFHVPRWREATMHNFTVYDTMCTMSCVWGTLLPPWSGYPSPARLPLAWGVTQLPLPMPHDLPSPDMVASSKCRPCSESPLAALPDLPGLEEALPSGSQSPGWLASCRSKVPAQLVEWLAAHALTASRDLHLLSLAVGVLLSLLTHKTELIVGGVYGAGKTQCIALLAAFFALRGHQVYYASTENTTIVAMATFVQELLPRAPDEAWPTAIRLAFPTHKLARVKARILMPVTPTKTSRSGMLSLSWPPQGSILRSFGNRIARWPKQWTMLTSSSMMKPSKRLPSAI